MATKKSTQIAADKAASTILAVNGMSQSKALLDIASTQDAVQKALSDVSATISSKLSDVQKLDEAIALKTAELKTLHQV